MSTLEMKRELVQLIESEENPTILEAVREMLLYRDETVDPVLKAKLISRAKKAEEDIKAGRVYTVDEFHDKFNELLANKK